MAQATTTIGLQIEGLGLFEDRASATIWQYRTWRHIPDVEKPSEWREHGLRELPRGVSSSIDPFAREWANSAFVFRMPVTENVLKTLFWQVNEPFYLLDAAIDASQTTLPINTPGLEGSVIFIGRETVRLGTFLGGVYTDCERGYWTSKNVPHPEGSGVYGGPPKLKDRQVWIVQLDIKTRTIKRKWTGFLKNVSTDSTYTSVDVQCSEYFSTIARLRLNRDARNLAIGSSLERVQTPTSDFIRGVIPDYTPRMRKLDQTSASVVWLDVDGRLVRGVYNGRDVTIERVDNLVVFDNHEPELIPEEDIVKITPVTDCFEVFFVDPEADAAHPFGNVSSTSALFNPYNRVAIAYGLLVSTIATATSTVPDLSLGFVEADVFGPNAALDIEDYLDVESWWEAIAAAEESLPVERMAMFFGGDSPEALDVVSNILLGPGGFILTITEAGLLGCQRFEAMDIRQLCEAFENPIRVLSPREGGVFELDGALGSGIDQIVAKVGGAPWQKPSKQIINAGVTADTVRPDFAASNRVTFDLQTLKRARAASSFDGDSGDDALLELIAFIVQAHWASPRLKIRTRGAALQGLSEPFDLGRYISIGSGFPSDKVFPIPDAAGGRPKLITLPDEDQDTLIRLTGMIIGRDWKIESQLYELTLLLQSYRNALVARLRAPSMRLTGVVGASDLLIGPVTSDYGEQGEDAQIFKVGDQVELWHRDGRRWADSVVREIIAITDETIQLDGWFASAPPAGLILRLAPSTTYDNDAHVACFNRPWVCLGDDNGELDVLGELEEADRYG